MLPDPIVVQTRDLVGWVNVMIGRERNAVHYCKKKAAQDFHQSCVYTPSAESPLPCWQSGLADELNSERRPTYSRRIAAPA
jgi:hypothetical protein